MVIIIPWKNGVFSVLVYCGIVCIYCTKRKYTSKGVELHLEECLFKNYISFSSLFPLYPAVFVLQNSLSSMLRGKCFSFPQLVCIYSLADVRTFSPGLS